MLQVDVLNF